MSDLQTNQTTEISIFNPQSMQQLSGFAEMMSSSVIAVPEHLRGKPADCMAIAMQAVQWGMNPYAVAQKTHIVNGKLGYEAQLISAVIGSSRAIRGRFKYEFCGDWSKFNPQNKGSENGLGVRCGAVLAGESDFTWGQWIYLNTITTRNSPLWKTNPQQQIQYLATKYWARIYTPDVILGVYDHEEIQEPTSTEREINPRSASELNAALNLETNENPEDFFDDSLRMSKRDEIAAMISTATDRDGYKEAAQIYAAALTSNEITTSEAEELKPMLTDLYNKLK